LQISCCARLTRTYPASAAAFCPDNAVLRLVRALNAESECIV